jgi:hypothetical protein
MEIFGGIAASRRRFERNQKLLIGFNDIPGQADLA